MEIPIWVAYFVCHRPDGLEVEITVICGFKEVCHRPDGLEAPGQRLVDKVIDMLSSLQQHELLLVQKTLEDKLHEFYI